jgi:alkaline phosphatase D
MEPTRRGFLTAAGALAVAGLDGGCDPSSTTEPSTPPPAPAPERAPEPEPWVPDGTPDDRAFGWALVAGDATPTGVLLSAFTSEPSVDVTVVEARGDTWVEVQRHPQLTPEGGWVQLELLELTPDTAYTVVLHSTDGERRSAPTRVRTALPVEAPARRVTFGATSCLGSSNPSFGSLHHAAAESLDFFLLLGDTVYADGSIDEQDYEAEWHAVLSHPAFRALAGSTSVVATWDDHEVSNNWVVDGDPDNPLWDVISPEQLAAATAVFQHALPQREGPGGSGVWRALSWGDVIDIVVLDCRGERTDGRIVSEEQLAWALDTLRDSSATFKLLLSSVHLTDHLALFDVLQQEDRWQGYPEQRLPLVQACAEVPGVLVITGDMHYGGVQRLDPAGGPAADVWEIAAGPSGSSLFPVGAVADLLAEIPEQYEDLIEDWTTCLFDADPGTGTLTLRFVNDAGERVVERVLQVGQPPSIALANGGEPV